MRRNPQLLFAAVAGLSLALPSCTSRPIAVEAAADDLSQSVPAAQSAGGDSAENKSLYPPDRGGALLTDLLAPSAKGRARMDLTTSPRRTRAEDWPEPPLLPGPSAAPLPRPTLEKVRTRQRPADLPDALPFFDQLAAPRPPEARHLTAGAPVREPSPDVNQPIPLPILSQQAQDRAALNDPTFEASLAMALALSPPLRMTPAPFVPLIVPNPFPHREAGRLRQAPPEDSTPVTATPKPPNKP